MVSKAGAAAESYKTNISKSKIFVKNSISNYKFSFFCVEIEIKCLMKLIVYFLLFLPCMYTETPPSHTGLCGIDPVKAYSQNVLGKNVGYYISLKNNSAKTVDGVSWTASFYNNFEDFIGKNSGKWESGNFTSPAEPGETMTYN